MEATDKTTPKAFWTDSEPGEAFPFFSKAFYLCRNTLSVELFEQYWKVMMSTFPKSCSYMTKAVNSTSSLCDVEKAINKRHDDESQYCKLVDLKAQQTTIGLPHLASQFFSNIDAILNHFLTPLVLSCQRFQISQSLTYEGQLVLSFDNNVLESDTVDNYFIEDVVDEPQIILQSFLNGINSINIIETWRIRRVGGLSKCKNLVILLHNGSHLCTCMESVTKGIICQHFWCVMLYSGLDDNKSIHQQNTSQRNRFEFITSKRERSIEVGDDDNLEEINGIERAAQNANIISLQKDLIDQITDPNVTKI
ncbi:unnamed protein product [Rhizophagus irregularis]|nr:unnamed protein product [Rhizophagus irregularis]